MTRYEMAQIVAKALAKGANVDRLAAEFADELDALGVRVAALEKKADNVKITGQIRYHWAEHAGRGRGQRGVEHQLRTRLVFNGQINDNWKYVGRIQNIQDFRNDNGDEMDTRFQMAYVTGRLGGAKVTAGRMNRTTFEGDMYDTRADGVDITYGDKVKLNVWYGKPANGRNGGFGGADNYDKWFAASVVGNIAKKVDLEAGYDKFWGADQTGVATEDNAIWHVAAAGKLGDFGLSAAYYKSNDDSARKDKGATAAITYGGAKADKVGSWGVEAKYYNLGDGVYVAHTMNGEVATAFNNNAQGGFKGYKLAGYYTVAKNMVAGVEWYDGKANAGNQKRKTAWTQLMMTF